MLKNNKKQSPSSRQVQMSAEEQYRDKNLPEILYESENCVVINKGPDIKVNSDEPTEMTVQHQLSHIYPQHVCNQIAHGFRFVHRLDFATSGTLCVAFNKSTTAKIAKEFKNHRVTKYYLALVRGHTKDDVMFVSVPVGRLNDPDNPSWYRYCSASDPRCMKPLSAQTVIVSLARGIFDGEPVTKVLMKAFTGRTHQLRVHSDFIGHTILGDYTYSLRQDLSPRRMMLHAYHFKMDSSQDKIDVTTTDPFTSDKEPDWMVNDVIFTYDKAREILEKISGAGSENYLEYHVKVYDYGNITDINS